MTAHPMPARRAREVVDAAKLMKAPDWSESRRWHVIAGEEVLVVVEPSYGGTSATGRNGWRWRLAGGAASGQPEPTREKVAIAGLAAWKRRATNKEN